MTFDEALGAEVKAARVRARLRQVDLAALTKIPQPKLSRIENGKESPSVAAFIAIGNATNRDPASLLAAAIVYTQAEDGAA